MRTSRLLRRLRESEPVRICSLGHFVPAYIHLAAEFGFDCIWLDMEHRSFTEREAQAMFPLFHLADIDCMLRPPTVEKTRLYRYLEDGATGLLIPHVSSTDKATALVNAVKFPPLGDRGLDGAGFDSGFLVGSGTSYPDDANRETFLVVQIETPEAVDCVDEIAALAGIDGLFIGPGDLGLRLQRRQTNWTLQSATERVASAAERHGKAWGCPAAGPDDIRRLRGLGAQLISHGGDFMMLLEGLKKRAAELESAFAS